MTLESIKSLIKDEFSAVNNVIIQHLNCKTPLIQQLGQYIIDSGGKRIRPVIALLSAKALNYSGQDHIQLAAVIEFIHTATLLHDDVVDASDLRRGNETANSIWGNEASVLVGDFLFSRAFQMMLAIDNMQVLEILANVTNAIAEGEVQQLMNQHNPEISVENYMEVIQAKTASLIAAGSQSAAILARQPSSIEDAMKQFGTSLGLAFQIVDDALDYAGHSDEMGKNIGDDLAEGKITLPLIYALQKGNEDEKAIIRQAISHGGLENLDAIKNIIASTDAIGYTFQAAKQHGESAKNALAALPKSIYQDALSSLVDFVIDRNH